MAVREVTGKEDRLIDLIDSGEVEQPELLDYLGWISWRAAAGSRPSRRRGDGGSTTPAQESALWRAVMEHVHGEDWRQLLADRQAEAAQVAGADEKTRVKRRLAAWVPWERSCPRPRARAARHLPER